MPHEHPWMACQGKMREGGGHWSEVEAPNQGPAPVQAAEKHLPHVSAKS